MTMFLRLELIAAPEHTMSTPRAVRKKTLPIVLDLRSFLRAALFCPLAAAGLASVDGFTGSGRARDAGVWCLRAWRVRRSAGTALAMRSGVQYCRRPAIRDCELLTAFDRYGVLFLVGTAVRLSLDSEVVAELAVIGVARPTMSAGAAMIASARRERPRRGSVKRMYISRIDYEATARSYLRPRSSSATRVRARRLMLASSTPATTMTPPITSYTLMLSCRRIAAADMPATGTSNENGATTPAG